MNCCPNVDFDIGAINNFLGKFFPAGFYYKTFMWPKSFWYKVYEPIIRKAAGFGAASIKHDKEKYEHKYEYCDLLITGSGPSGLASAYAAAQNGAKVILAEDKSRFGGSLLTSEVTIGNQSGQEWAEKIISELKSMPNVVVKNRSQVLVTTIITCLLCQRELAIIYQKQKNTFPNKNFGTFVQKKLLFHLAQ